MKHDPHSLRPDPDLGVFLGQMLRRPGRVVALAPSSGALARRMTQDLDPDSGPVIELGAGTGKITEAILARGVPQHRLTVFETDPVFADLLQQRFPAAILMRRCASLVAEAQVRDAAAVISGLPLLSIPRALQHAIVGGAFDLLRPGGAFVQFTYGFGPPMDREVRRALRLQWTVSPRVWRNLPPARVYFFRRAA